MYNVVFKKNKELTDRCSSNRASLKLIGVTDICCGLGVSVWYLFSKIIKRPGVWGLNVLDYLRVFIDK